jgi:hypothetical protein
MLPEPIVALICYLVGALTGLAAAGLIVFACRNR